jgi:hypothetical protein
MRRTCWALGSVLPGLLRRSGCAGSAGAATPTRTARSCRSATRCGHSVATAVTGGEVVAGIERRELFDVIPDRANFDYVYEIQSYLSRGPSRRRRQQISQFVRLVGRDAAGGSIEQAGFALGIEAGDPVGAENSSGPLTCGFAPAVAMV